MSVVESSDLQFTNRIPEPMRVQLAELRESVRLLEARILKLELADRSPMRPGPGRPPNK